MLAEKRVQIIQPKCRSLATLTFNHQNRAYVFIFIGIQCDFSMFVSVLNLCIVGVNGFCCFYATNRTKIHYLAVQFTLGTRNLSVVFVC